MAWEGSIGRRTRGRPGSVWGAAVSGPGRCVGKPNTVMEPRQAGDPARDVHPLPNRRHSRIHPDPETTACGLQSATIPLGFDEATLEHVT